MQYRNCMYAWNACGNIHVGPHPDTTGWSDSFTYSLGACVLATKKYSKHEKQFTLLRDYIFIVNYCGVDAKKVHSAFLAIDEYNELFSDEADFK